MKHSAQTFRIQLAFVLATVVSYSVCNQSAGQSVSSIPKPLPKAWVVDQTETLSDLQKKLINNLCKDIQGKYRRQMVVAVIDSTEGQDHRRFGVELFNLWRIGDGYKNQGVLVFAVMKDRAAEIILGHGIDNRNTAAAAQSIMDTVMIPKFKQGDAGGAIYEGVHACAKRIIGVGELAVPAKLPRITAEQPLVTAEKPLDNLQQNVSDAEVGSVGAQENSNESRLEASESISKAAGSFDSPPPASPQVANTAIADTDTFRPVALPPLRSAKSSLPRNDKRPLARRNPSYLPWLMGLGGVGVLAMFFGTRRYLRYRQRTCDACRLDRVLLTEIQDDDFLDHPQRIEEKIGSVDYDVWACLECEDVIKLRYGRWLTRYSKCPECNYVTRFKISTTVIPATTTNGGVVRVKEFCKHCDYHHTYTYATPRIQRRRSGSTSGSIFSGSSSRSSGGFSSGGGASGRW